MSIPVSASEGNPLPPLLVPGFPLRVAVVDLGSNAVRFTASEFLSPTVRQDIERQRLPIRLGRSAFLTRRLAPEMMAAAVDALISFRRRIDTLAIQEVRVIATSAVRESANAHELAERVHRETGLRVEAITGAEEAHLVWRAIRSRVPLQGRWMMMDLGGGSLELSIVRGEEMEWSESHAMGTVRLLDELDGVPTSEGKGKLQRLLEEYTATLRFALPSGPPVRGLAATGGNIEELAKLAGSTPTASGTRILPVRDLKRLNQRLASMTYDERVSTLGLGTDRADVIIPAGLVYHRVATLAGVDEIMVPGVGLTEGALLDLVERVSTGELHADHQEQEIEDAALALGRKFLFDERHARHVARLALDLYDQLEELHELQDPNRRILLAASLLHDIGQFVSYQKHHKHSCYLILQSELPFLSPREIQLVGLVARYHRRAHPKDRHEVWSALGPADRSRVMKLAAILRIADSLDREHLQRISSVEAQLQGRDVVLALHPNGEFLLEQWALEKKGYRFFQEAYGRNLRLTHERSAS